MQTEKYLPYVCHVKHRSKERQLKSPNLFSKLYDEHWMDMIHEYEYITNTIYHTVVELIQSIII